MGSFGTTPPPPKIKVSTYTGNGAATQAITGVGFKPDFLIVLAHITLSDSCWFKTDAMGNYAKEAEGLWSIDVIISLDSDGFTVGDSSGNVLNTDGRGYSYIAVKMNPGM